MQFLVTYVRTIFLDFCSILMKGITWSRDSHGLFDYESRHLTKKTMRTDSEIIIMRHANDLVTSKYQKEKSFEE